MSPLDVISCRVGIIGGPFTQIPSGRWKLDGDPIMKRTAPYWVVRYLKGTTLCDRTFASYESAKAFWDSLPDFYSAEANARIKAFLQELTHLNQG